MVCVLLSFFLSSLLFPLPPLAGTGVCGAVCQIAGRLVQEGGATMGGDSVWLDR